MMILDVDSQHSKGREAYKFGIAKANLPVLSLSIAELLQFCSESVGALHRLLLAMPSAGQREL